MSMDNYLMSPKVDFAFKELMEDDKARLGFISSVLKLDPQKVRSTHIQNTQLRKLHKEDKLGILDVLISLDDGTVINVEINLAEMKIWTNRSLFYTAKLYTDQIEEGENYKILKKCISISILDFVLFREQPDFYSRFHIREDARQFLYSDDIEFHVIELPKLPAALRENDNVMLWAKFLNSERREEFDMLAERDPYINSACQRLQVISQDKEKRLEYEARQKAIRDHNAYLQDAIERGIVQGEQSKAKEIAGMLLNEGREVDYIVRLTGLTADEVESLK